MVSKSVSKIESRQDLGVFHLAVGNTVERLDALKAKHEALRDGCDPMKDVGIRTSGSYGIGRRTFQEWDADERRFRRFVYDAMAERWIEQDTRPRWQQDLDAVRARLAAKGKLPRGGR
ncbi:MAG: hypothetical protein QOE90_800 [Thermoplasmata archaeon]|jgi:hypothetical protein|nr:hypothetical protein [Thermoplasmata archaeon]